MGESDKVAELAWKRFRSYRCLDGLDELLAVIGQDQRETVIVEQAKEIRLTHGRKHSFWGKYDK